MQIEYSEVGEAGGDDGEIGVGDAGVEGSGCGLGEVEVDYAGEAGRHAAEHGQAGPGTEAVAIRVLEAEPALADEAEHVLLGLSLQLRQDEAELVVGKSLVDASSGRSRGRGFGIGVLGVPFFREGVRVR